MPVAESIATKKYLDIIEIKQHLKNVEYIIMAAPSPEHFKKNPLHITIFLNTAKNISKLIQEEILDKFLIQEKITNPIEILSQIMPVGFSQGAQDTPMPLLIVKKEDMADIPHTPMLVMDFLADSQNFFEAKVEKLTGWTYSYN
jgi:hypothetical protein